MNICIYGILLFALVQSEDLSQHCICDIRVYSIICKEENITTFPEFPNENVSVYTRLVLTGTRIRNITLPDHSKWESLKILTLTNNVNINCDEIKNIYSKYITIYCYSLYNNISVNATNNQFTPKTNIAVTYQWYAIIFFVILPCFIFIYSGLVLPVLSLFNRVRSNVSKDKLIKYIYVKCKR
jgi:hypothetical protein